MIIDCDACAVAGPACDDCVVSVLLGIPEMPSRIAHFDDQHAAAIEALAQSGLVPPLRLVRRSQAS